MIINKTLSGVLITGLLLLVSQPVKADIHQPYILQFTRTYQRQPHLLKSEIVIDRAFSAFSSRRKGVELTGSSHHTTAKTQRSEETDAQTKPQELEAPSLKEISAGDLLHPGQSGPAVQKISQWLKALDYPVEPSSYFGRELSWQMGQFQEKHHLAAADSPFFGKVGPSTLEVLEDQARKGHYDAALAQKLVQYARHHVSGTRWNCYHYVANAIHSQLHPFLKGMHAYMAADFLAQNPHFQEIHVPNEELPELPAGAIVVWGKGHSRSGHISIADGQGDEISDHISPQMLSHYGGAPARVFLPVVPSAS